MKIRLLISFFSILLFLQSCTESPNFPIEPVLTFTGLSKNTIDQGSLNSDSLYIYLHFTDGDGDIGLETEDSIQNLFLIDSRTGFQSDAFKIPLVQTAGTGNGISGDIELKIYTTCCIFANNIPPCSVIEGIDYDTLYYKIYLIDNAGHSSDTIDTTPILIHCN
ncbi:MAG: hypothetical protein R2771_16185 [Saprospiraceae bacterium]